MKRRLFFVPAVLGVVLAPLAALAQSRHLQSIDEVRKTVDGIVASVAANDPAAAWKSLRPLSVVPAAEFDVFEAQFSSQAGVMLQRFGRATGYELVREEPIGKSLVRLTYLVRHEKAPMRWIFVFYRADAGWVATDFKFDGNTAALFPSGG